MNRFLRLHHAAIEKFGGLKGVRDINLLTSAVEMPKTAIFGEDLHPTLYDKASTYLFHIVCGHPLNDGNKRTGAGSAYLFLRINKARILFENYMENEIFEDFILKVSNSKKTKKRSHIFLSMEDSEIMANLAENDPSLRSAEGLSFFSG